MALTTVRPQGMGFNTGRRNLIINGAMQVAQRGTSATVTTGSGPQTCDRMSILASSSGTFDVTQSTTSPEGFSNSFKIDCTSADASPNYFLIEHKIEGQNLQQLKKGTSNAESVTLSFYVRSSKTGTYQVNLRDNDNSRQIGSTYTISSANTWERKEVTFAGDTTGAFDNDNASSLEIEWWLAAGSTYNSGAVPTAWEAQSNGDRAAGLNVAIGASTSDDFHITGIQLELGENASDFEHRSFGEELALCQRYFFQNGNSGHAFQIHGSGQNLGTGTGDVTIHLPVTMRATPTITSSNIGVGSGTQLSAVSAFTSAGSNGQKIFGRATHTSHSYTTGDGCMLMNNNNAAGYVRFDAEL
jgi:hypothetical protein